jgi:opacity protein-like surface antigen
MGRFIKHSAMPLAVGFIAMVILAVPAYAEDEGWYLNFGAGVNLMSAEFNADPGFRVSAAGGYNFNRYFGLELETGYLYNSLDPLDSGDPAHLGQVPLMFNGVLRFANESDWVPSIGFGLGAAALFEEGTDGGAFTVTYQPMAGVHRVINENMSVGVRYKYLGYVAPSLFLDTMLGNHSIMFELNKTF